MTFSSALGLSAISYPVICTFSLQKAYFLRLEFLIDSILNPSTPSTPKKGEAVCSSNGNGQHVGNGDHKNGENGSVSSLFPVKWDSALIPPELDIWCTSYQGSMEVDEEPSGSSENPLPGSSAVSPEPGPSKPREKSKRKVKDEDGNSKSSTSKKLKSPAPNQPSIMSMFSKVE